MGDFLPSLLLWFFSPSRLPLGFFSTYILLFFFFLDDDLLLYCTHLQPQLQTTVLHIHSQPPLPPIWACHISSRYRTVLQSAAVTAAAAAHAPLHHIWSRLLEILHSLIRRRWSTVLHPGFLVGLRCLVALYYLVCPGRFGFELYAVKYLRWLLLSCLLASFDCLRHTVGLEPTEYDARLIV